MRRVLTGKLDELLDTLAATLGPAAQLRWLRTPTDLLDGLTPIEAVARHRTRAVLALAASPAGASGSSGADAETPER